MQVPSELAMGDRQLLLGWVAIPHLAVSLSALGREGWDVATGSWAAAVTEHGLTTGWTLAHHRLSGQLVSGFDFGTWRLGSAVGGWEGL